MTRALKRASDEAEHLGHPVWGSEHIVLALTRLDHEEAGRAPEILARLGVTEDVVRALVERHCEGHRESNGEHDPVRAGPEVAYIVTHTRWLAIYLGQTPANGEHLLLGTLQHHKAESKVLRKLGLSFEDAYTELTGAEPPPELRPERPLYVPEAQLAPLLRYLPDVLPEGASYSFGFDDELAWFNSPADEFEVYVQRALARAGE